MATWFTLVTATPGRIASRVAKEENRVGHQEVTGCRRDRRRAGPERRRKSARCGAGSGHRATGRRDNRRQHAVDLMDPHASWYQPTDVIGRPRMATMSARTAAAPLWSRIRSRTLADRE